LPSERRSNPGHRKALTNPRTSLSRAKTHQAPEAAISVSRASPSRHPNAREHRRERGIAPARNRAPVPAFRQAALNGCVQSSGAERPGR
jgi:hypothetical protein